MLRFLFKSNRDYDYYLIVAVILIPLSIAGAGLLWDRVANYQGQHYSKYGYQLDVPSGWKTIEAENYTWFKAKPRSGKRGATLFLGRSDKKPSEMSDQERRELFTEIEGFPKDLTPKRLQHPTLNCEVWTYEASNSKVPYGEIESYNLLTRRMVIWHEDGVFSLLLHCDQAHKADFEADWKTMTESIKPAP